MCQQWLCSTTNEKAHILQDPLSELGDEFRDIVDELMALAIILSAKYLHGNFEKWKLYDGNF